MVVVCWRTERADATADIPFIHAEACRYWPEPTHGELIGTQVMLETIAVLLIIFWILGLVTSYTLGGFIHLLLVIAVVMVLLRFIQGRRV